MPRASIPISLRIMADNDSSVAAGLAALEKQIDNAGKKTAESLNKPLDLLKQTVGETGKKIRETLTKDVAGAVDEVSKSFRETSKEAAKTGAATVRAAKAAARGVADAEQQATVAGEKATTSAVARTRARAAAIKDSLQTQVQGLGDFLGSSLGRFSSVLSRFGAGSGGIFGDVNRFFGSGALSRGFAFQEIDLSSFTKLKEQLGPKLQDLQRIVAGVGAVGVAAMAGLSASLFGVAGAAIGVAAKFQLFGAQLETVQHSAARARESLKFATEFAAHTPFTVEGLIDATVKLEVYGQRSKEILPLVADLAAGMGKRIEDTALVIGKALSGSVEGFKSLRNEYGIGTRKIYEAGGALDSLGRISIKSSDNLERNRQALLKIISTDFAGAVERQSKTLIGALSNLKDAAINLANDFGAPLLGVSTSIILGFTKLLETSSKIPREFKAFVAEGAVLTAAILALTAALGGAALACGGLGLALGRIGASEALAVFPALAGNVSALGSGFAAASRGLGGFLFAIRPLLGIAAVLLGVKLAADNVTDVFVHQQEALQDSLKLQADAFTSATNSLRTYREVLKGALNDYKEFHNLFSGSQTDTFQFSKDLEGTLANTDKFKLISGLRQKGFDLEELRKQAAQQADDPGAPALAALRNSLQADRKSFNLQSLPDDQQETVRGFLRQEGIQTQTERRKTGYDPRTGDQFSDITVPTDPVKFQQSLKLLEEHVATIEKARLVTARAAQIYGDLGARMDTVIDESKQFAIFSRVAIKNKDDVLGLNVALTETDARIAKITQLAGDFGIKNLSKQEILRRINDPSIKNDPKALEFFEEYVRAVDQRTEILDAQNKREKNATKERLTSIKFAAEYENSLRPGVIRKEEGELVDRQRIIDKQLEQVKGYAAQRIKVEAELHKTLSQLAEVGPFADGKAQEVKLENLQEKAFGLRRKLADLDELSGVEVGLRNEKQGNSRQQLTLKASNAKEELQNFLDGSESQTKDLLADHNLDGAGRSVNLAIAGLTALETKNKDLIAQSPELRRAFEQAFNKLGDQLRNIEKQVPVERFRELQDQIRNLYAEADTPLERFRAGQQARGLVNSAASLGPGRGGINAKDAKSESTRLNEADATFRREQDKDRVRLEKALAAERVADLTQQLDLLHKLGQADLENLKILDGRTGREKRILDLQKEQLRAKIEALRQAAAEEIRQYGNTAQVQQKFTGQLNQLLRSEAINLAQQARNKPTQDTLDQSRLDRARKGRIGGKNSPLQTMEAALGGDEAEDTNETSGFGFSGVKQNKFGQFAFRNGKNGGGLAAADESLLNRHSGLETPEIKTPQELLASLGTSITGLADGLKNIEVKGNVKIDVNVKGASVESFTSEAEGFMKGARTTIGGRFSDVDLEARRQSSTQGGRHGR